MAIMNVRLSVELTALLLFAVVSGVWSHAGHHGHSSLDHQQEERQDFEIGSFHIGGVHFRDRDDFISHGGRCGAAEPSHTDKLIAAEILRKYRESQQNEKGRRDLDESSDRQLGPWSNWFLMKAPRPTPVSPPVTKPSPFAPPVTKPTPVAPPVTKPTPVTPPVSPPTPVASPVLKPTPVTPPVTPPTPVAAPVTKPTPVSPPVAKPSPVAAPVTKPTPVTPPVTPPTPVAAPVAKPTPVSPPVAKPTPVAVAPVAKPTLRPTQRPAPTGPAPLKVETWIHVITSSTGVGYLSLKQINAQMTTLNNAYSKSSVTFYLAGVTCTASDAWYDPKLNSTTNQQMKTMLRKGKSATLNIFLKPLDNLLGYSSMPGWYNKYWWDDGVVIIPTSIPGGSAFPYNLGYTAVHEVGHWLGLYHVFEGNSCSGDGDHVSDTPIQSKYTAGCPASKDSCPLSAGQDSLHNYMDYSDDACMDTFTAGQAEMIAAMWQAYRLADYLANPNPSPVKSITCKTA